jgi:hypothetical protein
MIAMLVVGAFVLMAVLGSPVPLRIVKRPGVVPQLVDAVGGAPRADATERSDRADRAGVR